MSALGDAIRRILGGKSAEVPAVQKALAEEAISVVAEVQAAKKEAEPPAQPAPEIPPVTEAPKPEAPVGDVQLTGDPDGSPVLNGAAPVVDSKAEERKRAAGILEACTTLGLTAQFAQGLIANVDLSQEQALVAAIAESAKVNPPLATIKNRETNPKVIATQSGLVEAAKKLAAERSK